MTAHTRVALILVLLGCGKSQQAPYSDAAKAFDDAGKDEAFRDAHSPQEDAQRLGDAGSAMEDGSRTFDAAPLDAGTSLPMVYFYQGVGRGVNNVYIGRTTDGIHVTPYFVSAMEFETFGADRDPYGDPVMSLLANGRWAMTATTGMDHPRGPGLLLYHEDECPQVAEEDMALVGTSTASGCDASARMVSVGKRSVTFSNDGIDYVFLNDGRGVNLAKLGDATHSPRDLAGICKRSNAPTALGGMQFGDAVQVINAGTSGLLLSDTAIARRGDGTWVLFVKGIVTDSGCAPGSVCELCTRGIYRATSTDLLEWSDLELVMSEASVPEAGNDAEGNVWLYWQDFTQVCATGSMDAALRAPISGAYELPSGELSTRMHVVFEGETFETDTTMHYPTNGNPVHPLNRTELEELEACLR